MMFRCKGLLSVSCSFRLPEEVLSMDNCLSAVDGIIDEDMCSATIACVVNGQQLTRERISSVLAGIKACLDAFGVQ